MFCSIFSVARRVFISRNKITHVQYPSDARYKANACDTSGQRVSHAERTRFTRRVSAFRTYSKRVYRFVRTRFTRQGHALVGLCARVPHAKQSRLSFARTRSTQESVYTCTVPFRRTAPTFQQVCTFVLSQRLATYATIRLAQMYVANTCMYVANVRR